MCAKPFLIGDSDKYPKFKGSSPKSEATSEKQLTSTYDSFVLIQASEQIEEGQADSSTHGKENIELLW